MIVRAANKLQFTLSQCLCMHYTNRPLVHTLDVTITYITALAPTVVLIAMDVARNLAKSNSETTEDKSAYQLARISCTIIRRLCCKFKYVNHMLGI